MLYAPKCSHDRYSGDDKGCPTHRLSGQVFKGEEVEINLQTITHNRQPSIKWSNGQMVKWSNGQMVKWSANDQRADIGKCEAYTTILCERSRVHADIDTAVLRPKGTEDTARGHCSRTRMGCFVTLSEGGGGRRGRSIPSVTSR